MRQSSIRTGWLKGLLGGLAVGLWVGAAPRVQAQQIRLDDVVRGALAANPSLQIQELEVRQSEGQWQAALGRFDPQVHLALSGSRDHGTTAGTTAGGAVDARTYSLSLQKQFRSGLTVAPEVEMLRQDVAGTATAYNSASVGLGLLVPLLRDRGVQANAALERAARHTHEASTADLHHRRAGVVLEAALAYWRYQAAWRTVEAHRASEARARTLLEETKLLIEADERPAADLDQLEANVAAKTAGRIAAEQRLFEAEQDVGLVMGLPFEQMQALGRPVDAFPPADEGLLAQLARREPFVALARRRRADLAASQTRAEAAGALLHGARNDLRPRLDLDLDLGYAGSAPGDALAQYFTPFGRNVDGLNVGMALRYVVPVRNRTAEGAALQRASAFQQQQVAARDLDRYVRSGVLVAVKALESSIYELKATEAAIALYRAAVDNEKRKFQMGLATLIDVINVEDRLTEASLSHVEVQQRYAAALVQLRYETGTLVPPGAPAVDAAHLITLPPEE